MYTKKKEREEQDERNKNKAQKERNIFIINTRTFIIHGTK